MAMLSLGEGYLKDIEKIENREKNKSFLATEKAKKTLR